MSDGTLLPITAVPFTDPCRRVLAAVMALRQPTVRAVAEMAGVSVDTAHRNLRRLRRLGLITWEPNTVGTLRAVVTVTPIGSDGP